MTKEKNLLILNYLIVMKMKNLWKNSPTKIKTPRKNNKVKKLHNLLLTPDSKLLPSLNNMMITRMPLTKNNIFKAKKKKGSKSNNFSLSLKISFKTFSAENQKKINPSQKKK
jgi:hypothetical protein